MSIPVTAPWKALDQWSSTAFLVAGILLFGYALLRAVEMVTGITFHTAFMTGYGQVAVAPLVVGLLGLYPRLNDRSPRLSLAGLIVTLIAGVVLTALVVWLLGASLMMEGYPSIPEDAPAWTATGFLVVFLTLIVGFLVFGAASLRTTVFSRRLGVLLLVPPLLWLGFLAGSAVASAGHTITVVVYTPMSVALVAIWHRLRTGPEPVDGVEPAPNSITR